MPKLTIEELAQNPGPGPPDSRPPRGRGIPGQGQRPHGHVRDRRRRPGGHDGPDRRGRAPRSPGRPPDDLRLRRTLQPGADDDRGIGRAARPVKYVNLNRREGQGDLREACPRRGSSSRTTPWASAASGRTCKEETVPEVATQKTYRLHLMVCAGTGCVSNHSFDIKTALEAEIRKHGLENEVIVVPTGCNGFCERGPILVVQPGNIFYQQLGRQGRSPPRRGAFPQGPAGFPADVRAARGENARPGPVATSPSSRSRSSSPSATAASSIPRRSRSTSPATATRPWPRP